MCDSDKTEDAAGVNLSTSVCVFLLIRTPEHTPDKGGEQMCPSAWMNYESTVSHTYLSSLNPISLAAGKSLIMKMSA